VLKKRSDIIKPKRWKWPIIRAFLMSCAYSFFYASLPFAALAQAASCFFTAPIFTCFFAAVILREKIGFWRISSILIGFLGVLYIIQPGTSNMQAVLFLPVLAGACYALAVVITRGFCADYPSLSLTIIHNAFYALVGAFMVTFIPVLPFSVELKVANPFVMSGWVQLTSVILVMIGITSLTHILAMTSSIRAYQIADSSFVAPFEYTYLVFAIFIDYIVWQYLPNTEGLIGLTMVISAGVLIAIRERSLIR
jgi:drug/metabolite transporter (DMT)-like permease